MSDYDSEHRVAFKDLSDDEKRERIAEFRAQAQSRRDYHQDGSYYAIDEAFDEFSHANGAGNKVLAGAKLVGKSLFNIGRFTSAVALPYLLEDAAKKAEKSMKK